MLNKKIVLDIPMMPTEEDMFINHEDMDLALRAFAEYAENDDEYDPFGYWAMFHTGKFENLDYFNDELYQIRDEQHHYKMIDILFEKGYLEEKEDCIVFHSRASSPKI